MWSFPPQQIPSEVEDTEDHGRQAVCNALDEDAENNAKEGRDHPKEESSSPLTSDAVCCHKPCDHNDPIDPVVLQSDVLDGGDVHCDGVVEGCFMVHYT